MVDSVTVVGGELLNGYGAYSWEIGIKRWSKNHEDHGNY